jgi:polyhydroxyalkanoate synthesis repressor PhaR
MYDTAEKRYVTMADIRRLVLKRIDFMVLDQRSDSDITRQVLLQVIVEGELASEPLLTQGFLAGLIRASEVRARGHVAVHLERSVGELKSLSPPAGLVRESAHGREVHETAHARSSDGGAEEMAG